MNRAIFQGRSKVFALRRCSQRVAIAVLMAAPVLSIAGCQWSSPSAASMYPSEIEELAVNHQQRDPLVQSQLRGREVYQHYCVICHGAEAHGNGFNAAMLDPPPRNFGDPAFKKQVDDDHIHRAIHDGGKAVGKSVLMPAWGHTLSKRQIRDVTAYLHTVPTATPPEPDGSAEE